jgi:hypothetical protein
MVAFNTIPQTVIPDRVRGRVFTLLDVTWSAMRLLAGRVGIVAVYVAGGTLLALAGALGLVPLGPLSLQRLAMDQGVQKRGNGDAMH